MSDLKIYCGQSGDAEVKHGSTPALVFQMHCIKNQKMWDKMDMESS